MGEARFSWQVAYGDVAGGSDVAEPGRPLRDGARGPPGVALGRVRAGRGHDLRLRLPACLDAAGPLAPLAADRAPQPLPDEMPPGRAHLGYDKIMRELGFDHQHCTFHLLLNINEELREELKQMRKMNMKAI